MKQFRSVIYLWGVGGKPAPVVTSYPLRSEWEDYDTDAGFQRYTEVVGSFADAGDAFTIEWRDN